MRTLLVSTIVVLVAFATMAGPDGKFRIVELPRPNGSFSFQQSEARKSEILTNVPSPKLEHPGAGCCIHIEKDDTITVYNYFFKALPEYSQARTNQSVAEVLKAVNSAPRAGAPASVLITSEVQLKHSKTIHEVLKALLIPSIQIYYVKAVSP